MASIIDDIYDVYGTHEELELFTNAIKRFNTSIYDPLHLHLKWNDIMVQIKLYLVQHHSKIQMMEYSIHYQIK